MSKENFFEEYRRKSEEEIEKEYLAQERRRNRFILIGVIASVCVVLFLFSITIIPTGNTGVKITMGQISDTVINPGFVFHAPFVESIAIVNNKQQDITFTDSISGETAERNKVFFEGVTVTYTINPEKSAWIFRHVSDYENNLLNQGLISSAVKTASKQLSPNDVTNRALLEDKVQETLQESVNQKYGKDTIFINKVIITNAEFEESYNNAILDKQKAQMQYEQQQIENNKNIEKAEADAKVEITKAEANAKAKIIEAEAEAEANRKIAESLSDNILKNKYYEKWNGELPNVVANGNNDLIYQIPNDATIPNG